MKTIWQLMLILPMFEIDNLSCQNIVPNPGFEDTVNCPQGAGDLPLGWYSSSYTPDYYNSCANTSTPLLGVPDNYTGHQPAYEGNGYVGILTYDSSVSFSPREYIAVQLTQPLSIGTWYYVSMYIVKADSFCSSNNIGFRFSTIQYNYQSNPLLPDNFAQVYYDVIISDTSQWVQIKGAFIADSAYQYIAIGNLFDDTQTTTLNCSGSGAYYYIDEVCVSDDSSDCFTDTGITSPMDGPIRIYPSFLSDNTLHIENLSGNHYNFFLWDMAGRIVFESSMDISSSDQTLILPFVSEGMYSLMLVDGESTYRTKIFVK